MVGRGVDVIDGWLVDREGYRGSNGCSGRMAVRRKLYCCRGAGRGWWVGMDGMRGRGHILLWLALRDWPNVENRDEVVVCKGCVGQRNDCP